jgi:hypothetical protein
MFASHAGAETVSLNFNATSIASGSYIWFNSVMKLSAAANTTVYFTNSHLTFTANGTDYDLTTPNSQITFVTGGTDSASTTFNTATNTWLTTITGANSLLTTNTFLGGFGFQTPGTGFGGIDVTWTADFSSSSLGGTSLNWQGAAAEYTTFNSNNNALGVKPTDDNNASIYLNSHNAGTPENYTSFVNGGGTGGGGSNFTGSYSGTTHVTAEFGPPPSGVPLPAPFTAGLTLLGGVAGFRVLRSRARLSV